MTHSAGIDPGVQALGYAVAAHDGTPGRLQVAGCARATRPGCGSQALHTLGIRYSAAIRNAYDVIEPVIYLESMESVRDRATTPQDLIDVQTVGLVTALDLAPGALFLFSPSDWKGSTPKAIHHERMIEALDEQERAVLRDALRNTPKEHRKEVLDAVGILLYGLGRIERTGALRK
jgi:hypothetical protein